MPSNRILAVAVLLVAAACSSDKSSTPAGCPTGQVSCGGACIDPLTSAAYCGASGDCAGANAGTACPTGQACSAGACVCATAGQIKCGGSCVDPLTSAPFCGASGNCAGANVGTPCRTDQVCTAGHCGCPTGQLECGGACVDPLTSAAYCGASGDCAGTNAGKACTTDQTCSAGACACTTAGQVNCAGTCIDPLTTAAHCGATGTCTTTPGIHCRADQVCAGGSCGCPTGKVECGGACIDPLVTAAYCGATGTCTGTNAGTHCRTDQVCTGGHCGCPTGQVDCGGTCLDPLTSAAHCGASGTCTGAAAGAVCTTGQVCTAGECLCTGGKVIYQGVCYTTCPAGLVPCGGVCINPLKDPAHCGAPGTCGTACTGGNVCHYGACVASSLEFDWRPIRVDTLPPRFAEGPSTKMHLVFDGTDWVDSVGGTTWTKVGTPPVAASGMWSPQQFYSGPFSSTNYWRGSAAAKTLVEAATAGDFVVCARFKPGQHPTNLNPTKILIANGKPEGTGTGGWSLMQMHGAYCFHYRDSVNGEIMNDSVWPSPLNAPPAPSQAEWSYMCGGRDGSVIRVFRDGSEVNETATPVGGPIVSSADPVTIGAYDDGTSSLLDGGVYEIILTTDRATFGNMRNLVASASGAVSTDVQNAFASLTGADAATYLGPTSTLPFDPSGFLTGTRSVLFGATVVEPTATTGACIGLDAGSDDWSTVPLSIAPIQWGAGGYETRMQWDNVRGQQCAIVENPTPPTQFYGMCIHPPTLGPGRHVFQQCYDATTRKMRIYVDGTSLSPVGNDPVLPPEAVPHFEDPTSNFLVRPNTATLAIYRVMVCPSSDPTVCR